MRHWILGIIVACLVLTANFALAQETDPPRFMATPPPRFMAKTMIGDQEFVFTDVEAFQQFIADHDFPEEILQDYQRTIDAVIESEELFREETRRFEEQQHQLDEMQRRLLEDIGITEAEMDQFDENLTEKFESYLQLMDIFNKPIESDNYVEVIDALVDDCLVPIVNDIRSESLKFFTEEQYTKWMSLAYQIIELGSSDMVGILPDADIITKNIVKSLLILPDVVGMTEEQFRNFVQAHKDIVKEELGTLFMLEQEEELLETQLSHAGTEEERVHIQERLKKVREEAEKFGDEISRRFSAKMKSKLDTLLTAGQKAKLAQIKQDTPDYLKTALGIMETDSTDETDNASVAWRPGINSWTPGMGAPKNLEGYNREAPRVRQPKERPFPGGK